MEATADVVIIGGGIIGCAIAWYLRKRQVGVTLIERGEIGGQASRAAAGLLAPLGPLSGPGPFADLVLAGFALFPAVVAELEEATGLHLGYERSGALRTVSHPERAARLRKRMQRWLPLGLRMEWLDGEGVRRREPLLSSEICAAVYAPEEAQIEAPRVVQAFACAACQRGAELLSHQDIVGLVTEGARVTGVRMAEGTTLACSALVIAAGAWSAECASWLRVPLPIGPLHGQLLTFAQTTPALRHIIFGDGIYLAPRGDRIIVGATKEERGFDVAVTEEGIAWLTATARRLLPSLVDQPVQKAWAGLRPKTPDYRPILGPLPGWENVSIAAGHNSVGVILSAITGQSMAELLSTGRAPEIIRPFALPATYA
jgi:glycine oxidase